MHIEKPLQIRLSGLIIQIWVFSLRYRRNRRMAVRMLPFGRSLYPPHHCLDPFRHIRGLSHGGLHPACPAGMSARFRQKMTALTRVSRLSGSGYSNSRSRMISRRRGLRLRGVHDSTLSSRRRVNEDRALIWNWYYTKPPRPVFLCSALTEQETSDSDKREPKEDRYFPVHRNTGCRGCDAP
jgi:hypothetical protein